MVLSEKELIELQKDYEETIPYWLNTAQEQAQKGMVETVVYCFNEIKRCKAVLPNTKIAPIEDKEREIMDIAYKKGIERKLDFAKEYIELVKRTVENGKDKSLDQLVKETRHKDSDIELMVLSAYNSLDKAREYAKAVGMDIGEKAKEIEANLNSLGLKEYLSRPPF